MAKSIKATPGVGVGQVKTVKMLGSFATSHESTGWRRVGAELTMWSKLTELMTLKLARLYLYG